METEGLNRVEFDDLPETHKKYAEEMWQIFDRGVRAAKAENERLGIVSEEAVSYTDIPENDSLNVAESED